MTDIDNFTRMLYNAGQAYVVHTNENNGWRRVEILVAGAMRQQFVFDAEGTFVRTSVEL